MSKKEIVALVFGVVISLPMAVACFVSEMIFLGVILVVCSLGILLCLSNICADMKREKAAKVREQKQSEENNKIAKSGKWKFPAEEFYRRCKENKISSLNNEFSCSKGRQIAEQLVLEYLHGVDLKNCTEYLKKDKLQRYLVEGKVLAREADELESKKQLAEMKRHRIANANEQEELFLERAAELEKLNGAEKRVAMLTNLSQDIFEKIIEKKEAEQALTNLAVAIHMSQQKERSWGTAGGIAEALAGPAAGIMAAADVMSQNVAIRQNNEQIRNLSASFMQGVPELKGKAADLEREKEKVDQLCIQAKNKVVLSTPNAEKIWRNICTGKATVKKNESGVLTVSLPISFKEPFALDVPESVGMVVDGGIKAEVWFENKYLDSIFLPLPIYGVPHNMTGQYILDGMCRKYVEYEGKYSVKIKGTQNFWIMEA